MANRIVYFECEVDGHEDNSLNMVCIDNACPSKGLICSLCSYYNHSKHVQRPLKVFLNEYRNLMTQVQRQSPGTPNPNPITNLNIRKCKQTYDDISMRIEESQVKVQDSLSNVASIIKQYYEQQVVFLKRSCELFGKNNQNDCSLAGDFIFQGKQVVESIERSVPIKAEEQCNLVSILTSSIQLSNNNQMIWKDLSLVQQSLSNNQPLPHKQNEDNLEELINSAEINLMDVDQAFISLMSKFDSHCAELVALVSSLRAEIPSNKAFKEETRGLQQNPQIQKANKLSNTKMEILKTENKKIDEQQENKVFKQNIIPVTVVGYEGDKDSPERLRQIQDYLESRANSDENKMDESTSNFSVCKNNKMEIENQTTEKKEFNIGNHIMDTLTSKNDKANYLSSKNMTTGKKEGITEEKKVAPQRGYTQKLASLAKLNKVPLVERSNSDLIDLFCTVDESDKSNSIGKLKQIDYFESLSEQNSNGNANTKISTIQSNVGLKETLNSQNQNEKYNFKLKHSIKAHKSICKDIVIIDEYHIATCSFDCSVKLYILYFSTQSIWETDSGKSICELREHKKRVNCLVYSDKFSFLVSGSDDCQTVGYKDMGNEKWERQFTILLESKVQTIAILEEANMIGIGLDDGKVILWDIKTQLVARRLDSCELKLTCLLAIKEKQILLGAAENNLYFWKFSTGKIISTKKNVHRDTINDIIFLRHNGEDCFATAGEDKMIKIWSLRDYTVLMQFEENCSVSSLQYFQDTLFLSIWADNGLGYIAVWNLNQIQRAQKFRDNRDGITKIRFLPSNQLLACALDNGILEIYSCSFKS